MVRSLCMGNYHPCKQVPLTIIAQFVGIIGNTF
ncbi:hypothetical protein VPHK406_0233 [Vibrio phage K406]